MYRIPLTLKIWKFRLLALLSLFGAYPGTVSYNYVFMYQSFAGTAADTYTVHTFETKSKAIYVWSWTNPLYIQVSYDGTNYDGAVEIAADTLMKLSLSGEKVRVINKVAGDDARYQVVAWYQIAKRRL